MYGYFTSYGYMGLVDGRWMLFATDAEYVEYCEDNDKQRKEDCE